MLKSKLKEFLFSQSALGAYQTCQLKFRRRYLEGLYWPRNWVLDREGQFLQEQGSLFHLLAQRYYITGDEQAISSVAVDPVREWLRRLREFRPFETKAWFSPEQELRLQSSDLRLVAKYDLLMALPDGRVVIYDWKTTGKPQKIEYWRNHLQTIVYRYLLCAAGEACLPQGPVEPERLTMIYWNPQYPESVVPLAYSLSQFQRDGKFLARLIAEIESREFDGFLATSDERRCRSCEYSAICLGEKATELELEDTDVDLDLDWESIDQVIEF